jgi:hypothetical protein
VIDEVGVTDWFDRYLTALAARGRGEADDLEPLLEFYGVPMLAATDGAASWLMTADDVIAFARQQVDGMRAAQYHHTETHDAQVTALNATSAIYRGAFSRHGVDGAEIGRLSVTYLITNGPPGLRISAVAIHTP